MATEDSLHFATDDILGSLTAREAKVLRMRFGIVGIWYWGIVLFALFVILGNAVFSREKPFPACFTQYV